MRQLFIILLAVYVSSTAWADECADLARYFSKKPIRLHGENLVAMHACDDQFVDKVDDYYAQNGDAQGVVPGEKIDPDQVTNDNIVQKLDGVGLDPLDIESNHSIAKEPIILKVKAPSQI